MSGGYRGMGEPLERQISREQIEEALRKRYSPWMYEKIANGSVAVAGLGGLGSQIALMLARAGVGELFLVDFDRVELSNLNRQAYGLSHLGQPKTSALAGMLRNINPYLNVKVMEGRVTAENAGELFCSYPIVCEAFDQPVQKAMLVIAVLEQCPKTIVVSGNGMAGYGSSNKIITQKKMGRLYVCGDGETEVGAGTCLVSPRVTACAAHQANMAVRLLLGEDGV